MPSMMGTGRWPALEAIFKTTQKIKQGYRILILAATLLLLGGAFFYFVYMPYSDNITRTGEEITGLKQRIALTKARAKNLTKVREEYARVEKQFQEALKILDVFFTNRCANRVIAH